MIIGWGSTYGPIREALSLFRKDGIKVGFLSFSDVWPLPQKSLRRWASQDIEMVAVENNATAQFARLIRSETGISIDHKILKYDGRPFNAREIYRCFMKEVVK